MSGLASSFVTPVLDSMLLALALIRVFKWCLGENDPFS